MKDFIKWGDEFVRSLDTVEDKNVKEEMEVTIKKTKSHRKKKKKDKLGLSCAKLMLRLTS